MSIDNRGFEVCVGSSGMVARRVIMWRCRRDLGHAVLYLDNPPESLSRLSAALCLFGRLQRVAQLAKRLARELESIEERFEGHARDARKRAVMLARMIEVAAAPESPSALVALGLALERCGYRGRAERVFSAAVASDTAGGEERLTARRRLASLAWRRGGSDEAIRLLSSCGRPRDRRVRSSIISQLSVRHGFLLLNAGSRESGLRLIEGGVIGDGLDVNAASRVATLYALLSQDDGAQATLSALKGAGENRQRSGNEEPAGVHPVVLAGFGWSGSGAVFDFLRGFDGVADPLKGAEIGLWSGQGGLLDLYETATRGESLEIPLRRFVAHYCFGHPHPGRALKGKNAGGLYRFLAEGQREQLIGVLERFLTDLLTSGSDTEKLIVCFQRFSGDVLTLLCGGSSYCLMGNCIPAERIEAVQLLPAASVVVCWRDPRDAYVSKKMVFPESPLTPSGWRDQLDSRIQPYLAGKKKVESAVSFWRDIWFEEFVTDPVLRNEIASGVGLQSHRDRSTFDPSLSARNIGIHVNAGLPDRQGWDELLGIIRQRKQQASE